MRNKQKKIFLFIFIIVFYSTVLCGNEITEDFLFEKIPMVSIATISEHKISNTPGTVSVVTGDELKKMGIINLSEYFSKIPGFAVSVNYVHEREIEVRGIKTLFSEKVKVMIDGHSVNSPQQASAIRVYTQLDFVPVSCIKQIEVIRGPGSALYGSNAFFGVINIITKDPEDLDGAEAGFTAGSFSSNSFNGVFGKKWKDFGIAWYVETKNSNYEELYIESDALGQSGYTNFFNDSTDISFKGVYKDFTFLAKHYERLKGPYIGLSYILNDKTESDYTQNYVELKFEKFIFGKINFFSKIYYDYYHLNTFIEMIPDLYYGNAFYKDDNYGSEVRVNRKFWENHSITAGCLIEVFRRRELGMAANFQQLYGPVVTWYKISGNDPNNWNRADAKQDILALYIQDEIYDVIEDVNLTIGGRLDKYSISGSSFNPRVGINWEITDKTMVKGLYGKAFRAPSVEELYNKTSGILEGNPDLKPETVQTFEMGVTHKFNRYLLFNITFFYSEIDDLIQNIGEGYKNTGEVESFGTETEIKGNLNKKISYYVNYSFADTKDKKSGIDLPDVAKHKGNIGGDFKISQKVNINTNLYICGKKGRELDDPRDDVASYTKLDTTVFICNVIPGFEIGLSVKNLFDTTYYDPSPNVLRTGMKSDFPREGRIFLFSANYKF